jgi:hypothetical protein
MAAPSLPHSKPLSLNRKHLSPTERVTTHRDPLATLLIGFGALLGVILLGYGIGFLRVRLGSGSYSSPSTPVCDTQRSSFLFWSSENKECN